MSKVKKKWAEKYTPIAESISLLFSPYVEVVIHDIETDSIVYIANAYSDRKIGDSSQLGYLNEDDGFPYGEAVEGPYENAGNRGQRMRSISSALKNEKGKTVGLMCINADFSVMETSLNVLERFLRPMTLDAPPKVLFQHDWKDNIKIEIRHFLDEHNLSFDGINVRYRKILIENLESKNLFYVRKSIEQLADIIGVSRATIYNDLKSIRDKKSDRF